VTTRDRSLAAFVAVVWGLNFLAVRVGLNLFPPFFLAALRYVLLVIPVVLFVPKPDVPLRWLIGYGLGFGTFQFGLLFLAIKEGMPAGLSAVVFQIVAPFTVLLGALLLSERLSVRQLGGIGVAVVGMAVIAVDRAEVAGLLPMVLTVLAALCSALGTLSARMAKPANPWRLALWMSVIPPLPLLALSAVLEGPATGWLAFRGAFTAHGWPSIAAVGYIVLLGTVVGSGIWTGLLRRYPAGTVAPFTMLSPVFGIAGAWLALHETPTLLALAGSAAVVGGVLIGTPRPVRPTRASDAQPAGGDRRIGTSGR